MKSIVLFFSLLRDSLNQILKNKNQYLFSFLAIFCIDLLLGIPWRDLSLFAGEMTEKLLQFFALILNLIVIVNIILIEKSNETLRAKETIWYSVPTYLIYTLYTTLLIVAAPILLLSLEGMLGIQSIAFKVLAGLSALVVGVMVCMVPGVSILIDNDGVNYFKVSYQIAKKNPLLLMFFTLSTLLIEVPSFFSGQFQNIESKIIFQVGYAFFDATLLLLLTLSMVRVFYRFEKRTP